MPAVGQTQNSVMTAIISGNRDGAHKLAEFYGVEHVFDYEQYEEALASGLFDAVYNALPNSLHCEYTIRASQQGIHALVEKPLAIDVDQCERMIEAAHQNSTKLMTAYRLHCEPATIEALQLVADGAIGRPRFFDSVFSIQMSKSNHRLKAEHWGGPLQDIGVYCLNAARHIFDSEPVAVAAMATHGGEARFSEIEETFTVMLNFPNDGLANFVVSFNTAETDMYRIVGTEGEIVVDPGFRYETPVRMSLRNSHEEMVKMFPSIDHFGAQVAYFSDCILTNQDIGPDGHEGLADVRIMRAIEAAAKSGRTQMIQMPRKRYRPTKGQVRMIQRTDRSLEL